MSREEARIDEWIKELAPSDDLRTWFGHDPIKWGTFRKRYRAELQARAKRESIETLASKVRQGTVTLVYGAKDEEHNNAGGLKEFLQIIV